MQERQPALNSSRIVHCMLPTSMPRYSALPCHLSAGERQQQVAGELEREFQSGLRRMQQANRTGGLGL